MIADVTANTVVDWSPAGQTLRAKTYSTFTLPLAIQRISFHCLSQKADIKPKILIAVATASTFVNWREPSTSQALSWQRHTQPLPSHCLPLAVEC